MLGLRRALAALSYIALLGADAAAVYIIYLSVYGSMTYYLGLLYFIPIFIFSYWMSTFFAQLTEGKVKGRRVMPKWARTLLNAVGNLVSLVLAAFWIYIYITQSLNTAPSDTLAVNIALTAFKLYCSPN